MTVTDITTLLGGPRVLGREIENELELDALVAEGLPSGSIGAVMRTAELTTEDMEVLIPRRTLMDIKSRPRLSPEQSDRIARLARVMGLAEETLGSREKARTWLARPNRALGGKRPLELIRRSTGAVLVEQVLGRLAHGVYS